MINVVENKKCCGCNACEQSCPKQCIGFTIDSEGFKYPLVDEARCIDCHLCEKVCPMLNAGIPSQPLSTEAMRLLDEEKRIQSSSGGVFTAVAEEIIHRGGVVFGASYTDDWHVVHTYTETIEGLASLRGSKYVQGDTCDAYSKVKEFLKEDRWVLFVGTPCQVRGLLLYLRKPYGKLITCDFVCHGVPSHDVLMAYVKDEFSKKRIKETKEVTLINFRDKENGWHNYRLVINTKSDDCISTPQNAFNKGYGANLYLRPSCHQCPTKNFKSGADITLADYWRVEYQHPEMDDDKGTSLIAIHTEKAKKLFDSISTLERKVVDKDKAYRIQTALYHSMPMPAKRQEFWASDWKNDFCNVVNRIASYRTPKQKLRDIISKIISMLGIKKYLQKLRNY